ncbi:MAG: hypothetical protein SGI86_06715 [Deltaproteobacteria bacterium]|nr:hypothetical protein [Deltaproteobacteria bacterium]
MMAASVGLQLLVLLTQTAVDAAVARSESIIDDGVGSAIVAEFRQELGTYGFEPTTTGTTTGTTPPQFSISPSGTTIASLREKTVVTVSIDLLKASRLERRRHFIMVIEKARALFDAAPANPLPAEATMAPATPAGSPIEPKTPETKTQPIHPRAPVELGAATRLSYNEGDVGIASHAALIGQWIATPHMGLFTRLLWPLQESTLVTEAQTARLWTFGWDLGASYIHREGPLQPYLSAALGGRLLLIDAKLNHQPAATRFGLNANTAVGIRMELVQNASLFFQLEAGYDGTLGNDGASVEPVRGLSGLNLATSIGILFLR